MASMQMSCETDDWCCIRPQVLLLDEVTVDLDVLGEQRDVPVTFGTVSVVAQFKFRLNSGLALRCCHALLQAART